MKLRDFLLVIFVVTFCALLYINQHTNILLISYQLEKNQATCAYLLDRHEELLYNVAEVKSPQNLQKKLVMKDICLERPSREQLVKIVKAEPTNQVVVRRGERGFFGFLTSQAQAEAH